LKKDQCEEAVVVHEADVAFGKESANVEKNQCEEVVVVVKVA